MDIFSPTSYIRASEGYTTEDYEWDNKHDSVGDGHGSLVSLLNNEISEASESEEKSTQY